jgi:hypothetical protein
MPQFMGGLCGTITLPFDGRSEVLVCRSLLVGFRRSEPLPSLVANIDGISRIGTHINENK